MTFRVLAATLALLVTACSNVATKIAEIKPGMKTDQVTTLLGRPAHIDHSETTGLQGDVYYYPSSSGQGRVVFLNNAVFKAEFIPGAKS